jgi:hypothetical protein
MDIVRIKKDDPKTKGTSYVVFWGNIVSDWNGCGTIEMYKPFRFLTSPCLNITLIMSSNQTLNFTLIFIH